MSLAMDIQRTNFHDNEPIVFDARSLHEQYSSSEMVEVLSAFNAQSERASLSALPDNNSSRLKQPTVEIEGCSPISPITMEDEIAVLKARLSELEKKKTGSEIKTQTIEVEIPRREIGPAQDRPLASPPFFPSTAPTTRSSSCTPLPPPPPPSRSPNFPKSRWSPPPSPPRVQRRPPNLILRKDDSFPSLSPNLYSPRNFLPPPPSTSPHSRPSLTPPTATSLPSSAPFLGQQYIPPPPPPQSPPYSGTAAYQPLPSYHPPSTQLARSAPLFSPFSPYSSTFSAQPSNSSRGSSAQTSPSPRQACFPPPPPTPPPNTAMGARHQRRQSLLGQASYGPAMITATGGEILEEDLPPYFPPPPA